MTYDDNIQALLSAASIVRDETHEGGNTAARVGQLLVDMITSFDSAYKALSDSIPEGVDLSILKSYLSKEEAKTLFDTQSVFNRLFVEDTTNNAIKALKHLYSVSDITSFGYVKSDFPSADVVIDAEDIVDGVLIATINGIPIYAPAGGGTGGNLGDYYTKTEINTMLEGKVNITALQDLYYTKIDIDKKFDDVIIEETLEGYATIDYVGQQIAGLESQYAKADDLTTLAQYLQNNYKDNTELENWLSAKTYATAADVALAQSYAITVAKAYADDTFVNLDGYQVVTGQKVFAAYTRFGEADGYRTEMVAGNIGLRAEYPAIDFCKESIDPGYDYSVRLIEYNKGILSLWESENNPRLMIGEAMLSYDSHNKALKISDINGSGSINLYATGDISAFSGLGSYDKLTDLALINSLTVGKNIMIGTNSLSLNEYGALVITGGEQDIYFNGTVYFDSDLELDYVNANRAYLSESSIGTLHVGSSNNYPIKSITADGTKTYITIGNKKYTFTPTNIETIIE